MMSILVDLSDLNIPCDFPTQSGSVAKKSVAGPGAELPSPVPYLINGTKLESSGTGLGEGFTSRNKIERKNQTGTEQYSLGLEVHSSRCEEEQRHWKGKEMSGGFQPVTTVPCQWQET